MLELVQEPKYIARIKMVGVGGAGCNTVNYAQGYSIEGVESIAVCLLWSFSNPVHENEIKKILEAYPQVYAAISHELSSTLGEYARSNTAIIDAYVGPVVKRFISTVSEILANRGLKVPMLQMQANGGCVYGYEAKPYATFQSDENGQVFLNKNKPIRGMPVLR